MEKFKFIGGPWSGEIHELGCTPLSFAVPREVDWRRTPPPPTLPTPPHEYGMENVCGELVYVQRGLPKNDMLAIWAQFAESPTSQIAEAVEAYRSFYSRDPWLIKYNIRLMVATTDWLPPRQTRGVDVAWVNESFKKRLSPGQLHKLQRITFVDPPPAPEQDWRPGDVMPEDSNL